MRRSASDPMECVPSHAVVSSRRETSASASGSAGTQAAAGRPSTRATRARTPAPESARDDPAAAIRPATATKVAASPS